MTNAPRNPDPARADREKPPRDGEKTIVPTQDLVDAPAEKEQLDEGLEESMDGSDPPSALQP